MYLYKGNKGDKTKSNSLLSLPGLEVQRNQYSEKKLKLLEDSWAGVFRK